MPKPAVPPWAALPAGLGATLRPHLEAVTADVIAAVSEQVPDYTRPLEGEFGRNLRRGVQVALGRFLDLPGSVDTALTEQQRSVYFVLGRGELLQGRELQALLAAYRVGARVAFNRFATLTERAGQGPALIALAESMFAYIDELSGASVEGYALEQSRLAGETDRRRAELIRLLLAQSSEPSAVTAAAGRAGWEVPDHVISILLPLESIEGLRLTLGPAALIDQIGDAVVVMMAAPMQPGAKAQLRQGLSGRHAVVGPAFSTELAHHSHRLAALASRRIGGTPGEADPLFVDEHLAALLVGRDEELLAELTRQRLHPLEGLAPAARSRLAETLLEWLKHRGERQHVAAALHVHPQTVGYRLSQLRELFGEQLTDPQARFELELCLRGRSAMVSQSA